MTRAGAEVKRMRSMWDSIETHCWPIDRLAAIVISSKAYWITEEEEKKPEKKQLTIEDAIDVTRPPPPEVKDQRGFRTRNYAVVGWSHKEPYYRRNRTPSMLNKSLEQGYETKRYQGKDRDPILIQDGNRSAWFVLRSDGALITMSTIHMSVRYNLKKRQEQWDNNREELLT